MIELGRITKRFAGVTANDDISFTALAGEVHALLGENGAGKSTLMSVLAGLYQPDTGSVRVDGREVRFSSPRDAIDHGIGMVYQHFMLVDTLTVAENMMLGQRGRGPGLDLRRVEREVAELAQRYRLHVDVGARIWQLSVGEQQRVEILRLLYRGAKVLIFDEPTAVLTPQESTELVRTLRRMAAAGFCIIFISHKLDEVLAVADRITVLRRGRVVASIEAAGSDRRALARMMIGRELVFELERRPLVEGNLVLEVRDVHAGGDKGVPALRGVELEVRAGEILGIAGVAGNGQRELAEAIAGLRPITAGHVRIAGQDFTNRAPDDMVRAGVAHVPEDRIGTGLIASLGLADNLILKQYRSTRLARGLFLDRRAVDAFAGRLVESYDVMPALLDTRAGLLSGGNQQKLLLARELSGDPRVIVAVHPTRGVDVGASLAVQRLLLQQRDRGAAILLISEDLDELLGLADRIAVLYEGRIMGTLPAANADVERIGMLMAGQAG